MNVVGTVDSLWRYPIKSMAGEALPEAFVDYAGVYGDRIFAFLNSAGHRGLPYFTGRDRGADAAVPATLSQSANRVEAAQLAGRPATRRAFAGLSQSG